MTAENRPQFLIVDGNNILHAWDDLLALHRQRRGKAHVELCRRLRQFRDASDYRVVVVFDGRGDRIEEERETSGIQIVYTNGSNTADDVIERLVASYARRYRITVATDDGAEQNLVAVLGAEIWSARLMREELDRREGNWRRFVR